MSVSIRSLILFAFILVSQFTLAQSNSLGSATSISPVTSCGATGSQTLYNANSDGPASTCAVTTNDVWYTFTTPANVTAINVAVSVGGGSNLDNSNAFIECFDARNSGAVIVSNSIGCSNIGSALSLSNLSPSTLYYLRVFTSATPTTTPSSKWTFSICVSYTPPPSNDDCSGATTLSSGTTNSSGTVWGATASSGIPVGCATGTPDDDVWYKFTTSTFDTTLTINLTSIGSDLNTSGARVQMLQGTCGSLASYVCGTTSLTASVSGGTTYYIRVYSAGAGTIGSMSSGSTFSITVTASGITAITSGRTKEVFQQTTLSGSNVLSYPWEITYGPDNKLWITEARGYKVHRMDPTTGTKTTVLDLNTASTDLSAWAADSLNVQFSSSQNPWPQGGLAGLAVHPQFLDGTGLHDFVYVSYVHRYLYTLANSEGIFFRNKIVRFTYNSGTGKLGSPAVVCDTIPGGQDHNSQRMIIAPLTPGGTNYLFYAAGDMGSGQYSNRMRPMNPQNINSYEGKILRFNLEPVAGSWIPADNPYSNTSAVYSIGIRNNQGFAYDTATNVLYGSSHGPFSDDEINIIESGKNYGHPLVIGFSNDGNYNGITAGSAPNMSGGSTSTAPLITNEVTAASDIGSSYKNPLFSAYTTPTPVSPSNYTTISELWNGTTGSNNIWPSEGWSGLDLYTHTLIPGWKRSLVASGLKWGRLIRLKLGSTGTTTLPSNLAYGNTGDTITYFQSTNRYRDLAFAPNGKDVFIIMDNNSATSGPGTGNSIVPACPACVIKYSFLGYADNAGKSSISNSIDITAGTANTITNGTTVTIDGSNNTLWVPITGPDGNIMAEIKANGQNLGTITSTFYSHSGTVREDASKRLYLNRSITIIPQNQPSSAVNVRLYITTAELNALISATNSQGASSAVSSIGDVKILKNADATPQALTSAIATLTPVYAEAHAGTTNGGYVLQTDISSFSSFYFGNPDMIPLPLQLISFKGALQDNAAFLQWETSNENNTSHFVIERSMDGQHFERIGTVSASGNTVNTVKYSYTDHDAAKQSSATVYYRLKLVDQDTKYTYSKVINLAIPSSYPVVVYPNPVSDVLNLRISLAATQNIHIQVTDMQGRVHYRRTKLVRKGTDQIDINTKSWPAQSYSIIITDSNHQLLINKKIIKM